MRRSKWFIIYMSGRPNPILLQVSNNWPFPVLLFKIINLEFLRDWCLLETRKIFKIGTPDFIYSLQCTYLNFLISKLISTFEICILCYSLYIFLESNSSNFVDPASRFLGGLSSLISPLSCLFMAKPRALEEHWWPLQVDFQLW